MMDQTGMMMMMLLFVRRSHHSDNGHGTPESGHTSLADFGCDGRRVWSSLDQLVSKSWPESLGQEAVSSGTAVCTLAVLGGVEPLVLGLAPLAPSAGGRGTWD